MCKEWYEHTRPKIIENYVANGKAQLTFLDMPILGMDSITASMASYCAQDQDKYWDYHVALYEHQEGIDSGWASNERLKVFAFTLDLNMDQFSLCLDSNRYYQEVKQNFNKAKNLGVQSKQTFFRQIPFTVKSSGHFILHFVFAINCWSFFNKNRKPFVSHTVEES